MGSPRMLAGDRRRHIVEASLGLFAREGFHGVTTRAIADASGVSEALLYRHFPSKEQLFAAVQQHCLSATQRTAERLAAREPSTALLVLQVYFMIREIIGRAEDRTVNNHVKRLCLSSLVQEADFVRGFIASNIALWVPVMATSLAAAERAGDAAAPPSVRKLRVWLAHHLAAMTANFRIPEPPVVEYGCSTSELVAEVVRFALRGLGLSDAAIERHLNIRALDQQIEALLPREPAEPARAARRGGEARQRQRVRVSRKPRVR